MRTLLLKIAFFLLPFPLALVAAAWYHGNLGSEPFNNLVEDRITRWAETGGPRDMVIAGDSRAEVQVISPLLDSLTGRTSVNVAASGCDLATSFKALQKHGFLGQGRIFVLSVSLQQINDAVMLPHNPSTAALMDMTAGEWAGLLLGNPDRALVPAQRWVTKVAQAALGRWGLDPTAAYRRRVREASVGSGRAGLLVGSGPFPELGPLEPGRVNHWRYRDLEIRGLKLRAFRRTLEEIGRSPGRFVLYHAPMSPRWRATTRGSFIEEAETEFSEILREEVARHPNMAFLDLYRDLETRVSDSMFYDPSHMNEAGARYFTVSLSLALMNVAGAGIAPAEATAGLFPRGSRSVPDAGSGLQGGVGAETNPGLER